MTVKTEDLLNILNFISVKSLLEYKVAFSCCIVIHLVMFGFAKSVSC